MPYLISEGLYFPTQEQIYTGTDISLLLSEIQKSQDVINKIKSMRQGLLGTALVTVMNEVRFLYHHF